jgi:hypothetical protein
MALIRMQMLFNMTGAGSRSIGWSETHYSFSANTLTGALVQLVALARQRVNMLGAGVTLRYLRVSDDAVFRDIQSQPGLPPNVGNHGPYYLGTFANSPSDFGYAAVLVRCQGQTDFYTRSLFISGTPDLNQDIEHPTPTGAAWLQQFTEYSNILLNGAYGFKVQNRDNFHQPIQITGLAAGIFTTAANHGLNPNDTVRIRGFKPTVGVPGLNNPNGLWRVGPVPSAVTFSLLGYTQLAFTPTALGTVRKIEYTVTKYTRVFLSGFTKKSRGRPFGLAVGRRRRRVT